MVIHHTITEDNKEFIFTITEDELWVGGYMMYGPPNHYWLDGTIVSTSNQDWYGSEPDSSSHIRMLTHSCANWKLGDWDGNTARPFVCRTEIIGC